MGWKLDRNAGGLKLKPVPGPFTVVLKATKRYGDYCATVLNCGREEPLRNLDVAHIDHVKAQVRGLFERQVSPGRRSFQLTWGRTRNHEAV
jgi:hypothetical protein